MNRNSSGRRYDREFKNNAVALVRGGRTITEVARDLGVSKWSLGHWVRQAEEGQLLSEPKTLALETPEQRDTLTSRLTAASRVIACPGKRR
jgi:transposase